MAREDALPEVPAAGGRTIAPAELTGAALRIKNRVMANVRTEGDNLPMEGRCNAPRRFRPGLLCRRGPVVGATRCRLHGGLNQAANPADPIRGGRIPTIGTRASRWFPPEVIEDYRAADPSSLQHEIGVATAWLARIGELAKENPSGGIVTHSGGENGGETLRLYVDLADDLLQRLQRLKLGEMILRAGRENEEKARALIEAISGMKAPTRDQIAKQYRLKELLPDGPRRVPGKRVEAAAPPGDHGAAG